MGKFISFDVEFVNVIEEDPNSQFSTAKIQAFSSGPNRHDLFCSEETLKKTAPSLYNKPILYNIDKTFDDFGSHTDADKSLIAGFVVPNSAEFEKLPDERLSLIVVAKLWKRYAPKVIEFFKRDFGQKKVSVEMELYDTAPLTEFMTEMKDFAYFGICLLGDLVTEASPGANIQILSFSQEKEEYQKAYKAEFSNKYSNLDLSIPETVKASVEKALALHKSKGNGTNSVVLAIARHLQKNTHADPARIKNMAKMLNNYAKKDLSDENSNDYISYLALGGQDGHKWAGELANAIDEIDNQKISYFGKDNNVEKEVNHSMEDDKEKKVEEEKKEEMAAETKEEEKQEDPKEEKTETPEEETKEQEDKKEEKMSLNAYLDVSAMLSMLEDETENYRAIAEQEFAKPDDEQNHFAVMSAMYKKMCKMAEFCNRMSAEKEDADKKFAEKEDFCNKMAAENEELKKFKAQVEQDRFNFEIATTMSEVKESMPEKEFEALQEKSKEFSLDNIDTFKNLARAKAFEFSKGKTKSDDGVMRYALPQNEQSKDKKSGSSWDRLGV